MKGSEIEVGREYRAKMDYLTRPARVRVDEVGVERRTYRDGPARRDGVRVTLMDDVPSNYDLRIALKAGKEALIAGRDIERPWTDDDQAEADAYLNQHHRSVALHALLRERGLTGFSIRGGDVTLSLDDAETLLGEG